MSAVSGDCAVYFYDRVATNGKMSVLSKFCSCTIA